MTEMEPREAAIDSLLQRSLGAPIPSLSPDFEGRLIREVRRSSKPLNQYGRILLATYGLMSVIASVVVMRGEGLSWGVVAGMILGPVGLLAVAQSAWHVTHTRMRRSTR